MRERSSAIRTLLILLLLFVSVTPAVSKELAKDLDEKLATSHYVYISSTRKDGNLSKPAEIWFLWHKGSVYVASAPTTWRVRRIKWGRPQAKIWIGKSDGPSFTATGAVVDEPETRKVLLETFAKKYVSEWSRWEKSFRSGLDDGSRVLVRYTPN